MLLHYWLAPIVEYIGIIIEYIGIIFVAISVFIALYNLVSKKHPMEYIRRHLAKRLMLGLEFIIAADILLVTITTDLEQILQLGAIVVIRVLLGYALRREALKD
jgi:uncharacterized membrane protein